MNDSNTNTLENFTICRDGQLSRWETYKPVLKHNIRCFGNHFWSGVCEMASLYNEACKQGSLKNMMQN